MSAQAEEFQRAEFIASAQRAAAVVAARRRGDREGAARLMADFADAESQCLAFYLVADLALSCLCDATGDSMDTTVQQINLAIEHGLG